MEQLRVRAVQALEEAVFGVSGRDALGPGLCTSSCKSGFIAEPIASRLSGGLH